MIKRIGVGVGVGAEDLDLVVEQVVVEPEGSVSVSCHSGPVGDVSAHGEGVWVVGPEEPLVVV